MRHLKKTIFIAFFFSGFIIIFSTCINQAAVSKDPRGIVYAGAASCRQCHQAIYDSFVNTAHASSTTAATAENIRGNFNAPGNVFVYDNLHKIIVEKRDSGYYQVLYTDGKETAAYRFDILFGSRHAQTSTYWSNDRLYELPLSHYAAVNSWATSPGYDARKPNFARIVNTECLDCHSAGIQVQPASVTMNQEPLLDRTSIVYGIDCERCHGPAQNHVNYQLAYPEEKAAKYIVRNSTLTRQQTLDACAVCHSGNDQIKIQSRFGFKMGDTLSYFFMPNMNPGAAGFDVHGNQYRLLQQSKCFRGSQTITCSTCHDPHSNATDQIAVYSQKCMSCHQPGTNNFCPKYASIGESIKSNCIDCHMPKQPSRAIRYQLQGSELQSAYLLRTHKIAVYKDSTGEENTAVRSFLKSIK